MAKRQEFQLKHGAAAKAVAERRKKGKNDECEHVKDANQHRPKKPWFLPPMRFSGTTGRNRSIDGKLATPTNLLHIKLIRLERE
jgi:hypothetical protein